jgi:hypothetical protein
MHTYIYIYIYIARGLCTSSSLKRLSEKSSEYEVEGCVVFFAGI